MTARETSRQPEINKSPIRLLLLIACAFFLSWGPGLQKVSSFNLSKLFPLFAALLIVYWLLFARGKFRSFPPAFNLFIFFVLLHTLICYLFFHTEEFTFSYQDTIYSQAGYLLWGASRGIMVIRFFLFVFFSYAISSLLRTKREIAILSWALGAGLLVALLLGSHETIDLTRDFRRATGGFLNPNALALTSLVCLFLNLYSIKCDRVGHRGKIVSAFFIIISIYGLLSAVSRTPLLSLAIGFLVMGFFLPLSTKLRLLAGLLITVIIVAAYLPVEIRQTMKNRVTLRQLEETRGSKRLDIWSDYLREFPRYALTGVGLDRSIEVTRNSYTSDSAHPLIPHETYLQILVEFGLIGLFLFLAALWQLGKGTLRGPRGERAVILGLFTTLIAYGLAGSILGDRSIWLALGVIAYSGLKRPLTRRGKHTIIPTTSSPGKEEDSPLSILMVLPHLQKGGAERQMNYLVEELSRRGHRIHVATLQKSEDWELLGQPGITHHHLRARNNYDPRILIQLIKLINRLRPDVIHTWIIQMDILGGLAALITGRPWIIREPSSSLSYRGNWKGKLRSWIATQAATIVSNSKGGENYWRSLYPTKSLSLIPNGLPLKKIVEISPLPRQEIEGTEGRKLILCAGRLVAFKNLNLLFKGLSQLPSTLPYTVVICGQGEDQDAIQEKTRSLGIARWVRFPGFLPTQRIWAMMKSADLFVNLSAYEGMPNAVMEAMACHCPLLVSDIPAHREFLDEENSFLVDPNNLKAVTRALQTILTEREESQKRAKNAAKKAAEWSIAKMAKAYEKVYREGIAAKK